MKSVNIVMVGDFYASGTNKDIFSSDILKMLCQSDIASCNFEGPIKTSDTTKTVKVGSYLSQSTGSAKTIIESGFNLINLANNHIYDYGINGLKKTLECFEEVTTVGAGLDEESAYRLKIINSNDIRIGFLAYGEGEFGALRSDLGKLSGFAWVNSPYVENIIRESRKKVDYLIIQVHAGIEEVDIPLPEWREKYKSLIDWGADIVVGHHPHVVQGWEKYNEKLIFYSLGNFYFDGMNENRDNFGILLNLEIGKKGLLKWNYKVTNVNDNQVVIDKNNKFITKIKNLNELLSSKKYLESVNKICKNLWEDRYKSYYQKAMGGKIGILTNRVNVQFLLHNLGIESHRWVVERALSLYENTIH